MDLKVPCCTMLMQTTSSKGMTKRMINAPTSRRSTRTSFTNDARNSRMLPDGL